MSEQAKDPSKDFQHSAQQGDGSIPAVAKESEVERLEALEKRLERLEGENRALANTVRDLARVVGSQNDLAARSLEATPPPPTGAVAHSISQHLAAKRETKVAEPVPKFTDSEPIPIVGSARVESERPATEAPSAPLAPATAKAPPTPPPRPIPTMEKVMAAAPKPEKPRAPIALEDLLAKGLLGVGGVVLLLGGVFAAVLIFPMLPPVARVGLGYVVSAVLVAAGFGLSFKALWPGRLVLIIGIAFGFFTSFAAGFLPITTVVPPLVSVLLMFGFVAVMAFCSEKWKSESVAGFGFLLGLIAALASAPTSQETTLFALVILAVGAGAVLVRHEWKYLNAAALVFIALGTLFMWLISPIPQETGAVLAHLGALACYYIVFTVAFASWGRVVLARERLAIEAPEQFATPKVKLDAATVAYSSVFVQVNSVVFGALAIFLLNITEVLWPVVHVPLLIMAALEAGRLTIPILRRGTLLGFHTVTALGLVAAAIVAYYSGLAQSAVLALMTLVIALLASRSAMLGWLRPLTIITAFMTIPGFNPTGATTPVDLLARLLPPVFLLASVLPWETIAVLRPKRLSAGVTEILEIISGNSRAAIASLMMTFVLMDWFSPDGPTIGGMIIVGKGALLIMGILLLGAWNWFAAVGLAAFFGTIAMGVEPSGGYWFILAATCWALVATLLWHELAKQAVSNAGRIFMCLAVLGMIGALSLLLIPMMPDVPQWNGLLLTVIALAVGGVGIVAERTGQWPRLLPEATLEEGQWSITMYRTFPDKSWRWVRVAWGLALVLALAGWLQVIVGDSNDQLFSAALVTAAWCVLWHLSMRMTGWPLATRCFFAFAAMFTICPSVLVADEVGGMSLAVIFLLASAGAIAGIVYREASMLVASTIWLVGIGVLTTIALEPAAAPTPTEGWLVVATGLAILALTTLGRGRVRVLDLPKDTPEILHVVLIASGSLSVLVATASGVTVTNYLVTASWGLLAAMVLVMGFVARDAFLRYAAFGLFIIAIIRFVISDMATMDMFTRTMAALGLAMLMIMSGIVYWLLRPKGTGVEKGDGA